MKIKCKKCLVEFETRIITTKKTYTNNDSLNPVLTEKTFERPQFKTCLLCRNIKNTLNFLNKVMSK